MKVEMEHRLQRCLQRDWRRLLIPSAPYPVLSSYPASDYVVPGVAHAASFQSFFVPIHGVVDIHNIEKTASEKNDQEGGGDIEKMHSSEDKESHVEDNPILFNERKRKLVGNGVFESFQNPKAIKTKTVVLNTPLKDNTKRLKVEKSDDKVDSKSQKDEENSHKFKFF
jgi:hypothetical protein